MQGDASHISLRDKIFFYSSIFFKPHRGELDLIRLHPRSQNYDPHYERNVRRKELKLLALLDEVLRRGDGTDLGCANALVRLEGALFSAEFYQGLIFARSLRHLKPQFDDLLKALRLGMDLFSSRVGNDLYKTVAEEFDELSPPLCRDGFLGELHKIEEFLSFKAGIFS